jgi:signal transduction histidine kinase
MKIIERIWTGKSSLFRIILASGTALLWVIVAGVQYKWARELSAVTQARVGGNLQSLMTQWHRDLYDELSTVCIALQVGPDSGAHDAWNDYLQRYADWNQEGAREPFTETASVSPDLVQEIYEWHTSETREPELLRLNPAGKSLDHVRVPSELELLLARLQANSSNVQAAMHAWEFRTSPEKDLATGKPPDRPHAVRTKALDGWQLDDRIPALVHPVVHHANPFNSQTPVDRARVDWLVVVLNLGVIQNRILPELANRHFSGPEGLEYKVAVVDSDSTPRMIYSSDPNLKIEDVTHFDSIMNIFSSSSTTLKSDFWQTLKDNRNLQEQDWRNFSAPGWFPVFQYGRADEPWVLVLQHRTRPVSQVAEGVWRRSLLTGGVVLLLLAANIGFVVFASHRAQKLATAQMEFVASTSHELLTPLSAIYCSGQNARDGLLQTKKDLMAHGSIITTQARQLIDLVQQNLLFAATRNAVNRFPMRPLQVSEILQSVDKSVAILLEESGCRIEYEVEPGLPEVLGDLSGLAQCLQNLVGNAIKYGGKNGLVGVSASLHQGRKDRREILITVRDSGPGIEGSELRNIFEPFYRSPKVVKAQIHGTGLGLTVAARLAEEMGGRLSVTSQIGVGSTFTLHLPVGKAITETPAYVPEEDLSVPK